MGPHGHLSSFCTFMPVGIYLLGMYIAGTLSAAFEGPLLSFDVSACILADWTIVLGGSLPLSGRHVVSVRRFHPLQCMRQPVTLRLWAGHPRDGGSAQPAPVPVDSCAGGGDGISGGGSEVVQRGNAQHQGQAEPRALARLGHPRSPTGDAPWELLSIPILTCVS